MALCTITLVAGVGTFNGTLKTAGNQTFTATDTVTPAITNASAPIAVAPGPADVLEVTAPATASTGVAFTFTVEAKDEFGNRATGYLGTVQFTSTDGSADLPGDYVFNGGDAGIHTFTNGATLNTAGTQTITATDNVTGTIADTSGNITVSGDTILLEDDFSAGGGVLDGSALDIGGINWEDPSTLLNNTSPNLVENTNPGVGRGVALSTSADGTVQGTFTTGSTVGDVSFGLVFNADTDPYSGNYWIVRLSGATDTCKIYSVTSGSETEEDSEAFNVQADTEYEVEVIANGDDVDVVIDGTPLNSFTVGSRAHKTQARHGIEIAGSEGTICSHFRQTDAV